MTPSSQIVVNASAHCIRFGVHSYPCMIGRDGFVPLNDGREGDFKTPLGTYDLRYGFYREDRLPRPRSDLKFLPIHSDDGWCDDPNDAAYNRPVRMPYRASAEAMFKQECVYDIVIVLGHNDSPPMTGLGSAIFLHICRPDHRPTAGCVAVTPEVMMKLLPYLSPDTQIIISA